MTAQEKFAKAYDEYSDAIFRHCYLRIYDRELAKELMQETFIKAWKYYAEHGEENIGNLRAMLYKIATNLIIDHSRKRSSKRVESLEDLTELGVEPGEDHTKQMKEGLDAKEALKIISSLKEEYREVLMLRYLSDLSVKQTAEALDISPNLVSVRLNRALQELRKTMKRYERT